MIRYVPSHDDKQLIATYVYDAWGNHKVLNPDGSENTNPSFIGNINPIRYRSYYYDVETGLYYLQSRYYDPRTGRFISPDSTDYLDPSTISGMNLYAYCGNNPVMYSDQSGTFWDYVLDAGFLIWSVADVIREPDDWENWVALGTDVVFAIVPFVPAGAGQIIKTGNKIDNAQDIVSSINKLDNLGDLKKVTIVGRNMDRVRETANLLGVADNIYDGSKTWQGYKKVASYSRRLANGMSAAHNVGWLYGNLRRGNQIIDIGLSTKIVKRGLFYGAESTTLFVWKTRNFWKLPLNYYL